MLLYVTLVSLTRATYSKRKKRGGGRAKGDEELRVRASEGKSRRAAEETPEERPYIAKRTFIKLRNVV